MRISKLAVAGFVLATGLAAAASAGSDKLVFRTPEDALRQGISAYNGGFYELALPALETLESSKSVEARFYIARIFGDNDGAYTNHPRAFAIYKALADDLQDADFDDENLAPIAAKSLTAVSMYLRRGIAEAGIAPDASAADRALHRAAITFNDEDAQFELAKVLLRGEGPDMTFGGGEEPSSKIENGKHWLSRLTRKGHPGAQAFLADLMWRGRFVQKDPITALNLIDVAVANAPASERVWIEDIYQNIYCNAGEGVRAQATGQVAEWRTRFGRKVVRQSDKSGLDDLAAAPVRTCANGEMVRPIGDATIAQPITAPTPKEAPSDLGVPVHTPAAVPAYVPAGEGSPRVVPSVGGGLGTGPTP